MTPASPAFFVSYTKVDVAWAEWIAWSLKEAGYGVVFQRWQFRPGTNWVLEMHEAARTAQRTVLVLSPDSLEAPFVKQEVAAALVDDPLGRLRKLIPVRVRPCTPDGLLKSVAYIDLVGQTDPENARDVLIHGVSDVVPIPSHVAFPGAHDANVAAPAPFPGSVSSMAALPTPAAMTAVTPAALPDIPTLRRQLNAAFDDSQFDAFCLDHFPSVYERFSAGMDRDRKTTFLLDHCRKTQALSTLRQMLGAPR